MIGHNIARLRVERGWTQRQLAEQAGIDAQNLSKIELNKVSPRAGTLEQLARALGVTVPGLWAGGGDGASSQGPRRKASRKSRDLPGRKAS